MVGPSYIVLHKTEWERIKKQSGPPEVPANPQREHLKALNEKSQKWIKTWPDSVASHVAQLEKQKRKQHKEDIAFIKGFTNRQKQDNTADAIKNAKQIIFERSNYGKKLLSALVESKILEERNAQIEFKKQLQEKSAELADRQKASESSGCLTFDDNEAERKKKEKSEAVECSTFNKESVAIKKEKERIMKQKEKEKAEEGENFMKQILINEDKAKEAIKRLEIQGLKEYEENKKTEKFHARSKELNETLTELYKAGQERTNYKMEKVFKKIRQGRPETNQSKELYTMVEQIQKQESEHYEDFVDSAIKAHEERIFKKEKKDTEEEKQKRLVRYSISQRNKITGEEERLARNISCVNKCACERQTILLKTQRKPSKKTECDAEKDKSSFLKPRNKLVEELKKREKEPSPWNATKDAHTQFAQNANELLKECKQKKLVRKVVDEYRRLNYLDDITLPIPNY